ncbi:hypothetical protein CEXT_545981 [Caerostris extrusa]|uniref:Uncharacterized protein n=1 Tax=Caerostris extrusa TaxID=172846 RepID=A0AAV4Q4G9_CAEEX|nr:hypothetical protein CEXT_545981 [Caerostris extrusa]
MCNLSPIPLSTKQRTTTANRIGVAFGTKVRVCRERGITNSARTTESRGNEFPEPYLKLKHTKADKIFYTLTLNVQSIFYSVICKTRDHNSKQNKLAFGTKVRIAGKGPSLIQQEPQKAAEMSSVSCVKLHSRINYSMCWNPDAGNRP